MTPSELELAAKQIYNAVDDPAYPSTMMMTLIYMACMEMVLDCNCLIEKTYETESTAGTREYAFPSQATSIRRVEYDGKKVMPTTLEHDPKSSTSTTAVTGTPGEYAVWEQDIIFFPTPDESDITIKVFAYARPQTVTSSSVLEVPEEHHPAIINYLLSNMYAKDTNHQMADYYRALWNEDKKKIKAMEARKKRGDRLHIVEDDCYINVAGFRF